MSEKEINPEDTLEGCQQMIANLRIDLQIMTSAKDLSPVGQQLAKEFIDRRLNEIEFYTRWLHIHQKK